MKGYLTVNVATAFDALPVAGALVTIETPQGERLYDAVSDANGSTPVFELDAPDVALTLNPDYNQPAYSVYTVRVQARGFSSVVVAGCQIVATATAILNVEMHPMYAENGNTVSLPQFGLQGQQAVQNNGFPNNFPDNFSDGFPNNFPDGFAGFSNGFADGFDNNFSNGFAGNFTPSAESGFAQRMPSLAGSAIANMAPNPPANEPEQIIIPPIALLDSPDYRKTSGTVSSLRPVFIPDYITVHLGRPTASAENVRVRFVDYIANVASSEIYPTWPHNALVANIHCITTFAINRVYTEWYRSRGFNFDITNSTAYDQYFVKGRNIYANIQEIAQSVFDVYARRIGYHNPFFTQFCNGTTTTCNGLSQWGTVPLAQAGKTPLEILHSFFPSDLELVRSDNIRGIEETFPGTALRRGSSGEAVRKMQNYLNRIRVNFPLIPQITQPNGNFDAQTEAAVRTFQRTFVLADDGIIGRATWNKISFVYFGVIRLAELDSEGERIGIGENPPTGVLRTGSRGSDVIQLQFLLNNVAAFYSGIPTVIQDGIFGKDTQNAVMQFQSSFGLRSDGVVGPLVWNRLYEVYRSIKDNAPIPPQITPPAEQGLPFPGALLKVGSAGQDVRTMQAYLNTIRAIYPVIPQLIVDGVFGQNTKSAVVAFQQQFMLAPDGIVGPITWNKIVEEYILITGRG